MASFRILGPVEAVAGGRRLVVGGRTQVKLLAFLIVNANRAVSSDVLIDGVWGSARANAEGRLPMAISRLRKVLEPLTGSDGSPVRTVSGGYLLSIADGQLDAEVFATRVREGCSVLKAGEPERARGILSEALGLWRGLPLAEVYFDDFAQGEIRRLQELRLEALEARIEADLQLGHHTELVGEVAGLLAEEPNRERLAGLLMMALYGAGRHAEALDVYQRTRTNLVEHLGLEPGPVLKTLQAQILEHSPTLQESAVPIGTERDSSLDARLASGKSSKTHRPVGLPPVPTPTIGRQQELRTLSELLEGGDARLVSVTGPGGVGKTRLALAAGRAMASAFADGVCWVELAGVGRPEDVGSTIARVLGVGMMPGESAVDALSRYLAGKHLLLVLDNFEHVLDAAPLLADLHAACQRAAIVVTSREPLNLAAERHFVLRPLAVPAGAGTVTVAEVEAADASALFLQAMRRQDRRFHITPASAPLVARICARLDGLPLALELAAARARLLGVEELADRLDTTLRELGVGPRDAPERHHTLEATIDWSYRLLDPDRAVEFVRFAVFAGGATVEAAEAVTGASLQSLEALHRKGLIDRREDADGTTRLIMLETIRQYAQQRLAQARAANTLRHRHLHHYLQMAEREIPRLWTRDEPAALQSLERETDNFHAALTWALDNEPVAALRLASLLGELWNIRSQSDGLAWLDAALKAAGDQAPAEDLARAHLAVAYLLSTRYQHPLARTETTRALAIFRRAGDHIGISLAFEHMALLRRHVGDISQARANAEAACRHARIAGDDGVLGRTLSRLAESVPGSERGPILKQAAELLARVGDHRGIAMAWTYNAYAALLRNELREATELLDAAQLAMECVDNPYLEAIMWGNIGLGELFSGDLEEARGAFATQLQLCARHSFAWPGCEGLAGMAAVAAASGLDQAAARLRGASRAMGYPSSLDKPIDNRLLRDHVRPARKRYGASAWQLAEQVGAALSLDEAIAYALDQSDRIAHSRGSCSEPPPSAHGLRERSSAPAVGLVKPRARSRRPTE